jgi:hypothetical protein
MAAAVYPAEGLDHMVQPLSNVSAYAIPSIRTTVLWMLFPKYAFICNAPLKALKAAANRRGSQPLLVFRVQPLMNSKKVSLAVTPANAGVQNILN